MNWNISRIDVVILIRSPRCWWCSTSSSNPCRRPLGVFSFYIAIESNSIRYLLPTTRVSSLFNFSIENSHNKCIDRLLNLSKLLNLDKLQILLVLLKPIIHPNFNILVLHNSLSFLFLLKFYKTQILQNPSQIPFPPFLSSSSRSLIIILEMMDPTFETLQKSIYNNDETGWEDIRHTMRIRIFGLGGRNSSWSKLVEAWQRAKCTPLA